VLAAGGYLGYQRLSGPDDGPAAVGAITDRSAPARPPWIAGDTPGVATCSDAPNKGLVCVGISSPSARQDDAEDEAADAAYEAVANAIAVRITDARWKQAVPAIYAASREAKLGTLDRAPALTSARRDVREARRAVAQALRVTGGSAVPATPTGRYWEQTTGPDGKRYLAFAQVALGGTELAKLVEAYAQPASALGATAVGMFPLVAWRYPRLERGAVLVALGAGPLLEIGLAEGYVVLSVGGRDVADAAAFAKLAADEHATLVDRGGTFRLKVQTADPAPREFANAIRAHAPDRPETGKRPRNPSNAGSGAINVWDRFGGGKGSGRDDPTQ
jgi:hypothetical protein